MNANEVPLSLAEIITMPIMDLKRLVNGDFQTSIRITRANISLVNWVINSRSANKFDFGEFQSVGDEIKGESDEETDDDDIVIMMNDIIPSPQYWPEFNTASTEQ